jgi:hypothetical protein
MTRSVTLNLLLIVAAIVQAQPDTWERVKPARDVIPPGDVQRQFTDPIRVGPIVPSEWRCLEQASVRDELKLTAIQKQSLDALSRPELLETALPLLWSSYVTTEMVREWLPSARDAFLKVTLTKEQQVRLRQVVYQLKEREFGAHAAFAMAAKDLGLGTDQLEDVTSIKGQRVEEIAKLVTSGERFEKVKKQVEAANGEAFEKMTEMLTRAQRERLKNLRGKPFNLKEDNGGLKGERPQAPVVNPPTIPAAPPDRGVPAAPPAREVPAAPVRVAYPPELFGIYEYEIRYLGVDSYRKEIGITEDQLKSVVRGVNLWEVDFMRLRERRGMLVAAAEFHDEAKKAVGDLLTPKQLERFHQLMIRRRMTIGGVEAACGYPYVVDKLKFTPIQLQKLKEGKHAHEVLTKEALSALDALMGAPTTLELEEYNDPVRLHLAAQIREREEARRAKWPEGSTRALSVLNLADRLRLSAEQITKLREIAEDEPMFIELIQREVDFADVPPIAGAGRSLTSGQAVADRYRVAVEQQCFKVLDEKQQSLAKQFFGRRR